MAFEIDDSCKEFKKVDTFDERVFKNSYYIKSLIDYLDFNLDSLNSDVTDLGSKLDGKTDSVEFENFIGEYHRNLNLKQDKTDDGLNTTNKTIVGAINEVFTEANGIDKVTPTDIAFDGDYSIALFHDGTKISGQTSLDLSSKYLAFDKAISSSLTMQVGTNPNFITLDNVFVFQKDVKRVRILFSDMVNNHETIATREWVNSNVTLPKFVRHLISFTFPDIVNDKRNILVNLISSKDIEIDSFQDFKTCFGETGIEVCYGMHILGMENYRNVMTLIWDNLTIRYNYVDGNGGLHEVSLLTATISDIRTTWPYNGQ